MIVGEGSVEQGERREEKVVVVEDKVERSVALLMNIQGRFVFERRL